MDTYLVGAAGLDGDLHQAAWRVRLFVKSLYQLEVADGRIAVFICLHHMLTAALDLADADIDPNYSAG